MESLVEVEDFPGRLLHVAALWDNAELLEDLLHGDELACLDARDSWGRSALHAAATNAQSSCLRILLQAGARADSACGIRGEGRTPLHVAAEHGHADNAALLVQYGANLMARDNLGLTPLDLAEKGDHKECMKILREAANRQEEARQEIVRRLQEACVSGDLSSVKAILAEESDAGASFMSVGSLVNHSGVPGGSNTLLFKASEYGHRDVVQFLIDRGADGRIHPVTKYSPLYIAAYNGHRDVVEILLKRFPELIKVLTVEKWSPLHAACINGHSSIFEYILRFPFRTDLLSTASLDCVGINDPAATATAIGKSTGIVGNVAGGSAAMATTTTASAWEYESAFNVNQCDVTGQSLLYLACCVSSVKIVDLLLGYKVRARRATNSKTGEQQQQQKQPLQQQRHPKKKSSSSSSSSTAGSGIQALISKLRRSGISSEDNDMDSSDLSEGEAWLCPVQLDTYCNNGAETALHNAVRRGEHAIAGRLLSAGADPNLHSYTEKMYKGTSGLEDACRNHDITMIDLLLKHSARDDVDCKALLAAAGDSVISSKLLSLKANQDLENEVNRRGVADVSKGSFGTTVASSLAYASVFPSTAVMINWHNQSGGLRELKEHYLVDAALRLNPKLKLGPKFGAVSAIHAITRLDLSNNELSDIPDCIWTMQSLKTLNLAQNKLECLPPSTLQSTLLRKSSSKISLYNCPVLEEIQLQDNRLQTLPSSLFLLKSISILDVSNNKLQYLPFEMWSSCTMKELNLSFNLLSELPCSRSPSGLVEPEVQKDSLSDISCDSGDISEADSSTSSSAIDALRLQNLQRVRLNHNSLWSKSVEIQERDIAEGEKDDVDKSNPSPASSIPLASMNLAHNSFSVVPKCLSCLCPNLVRLNMSYNSLTKFGAVSTFPKGIRHLDLSYNQLCSWPGDQPTATSEHSNQCCYAEQNQSTPLQINASAVPANLPENKKYSRMQKMISGLKSTNCCAHKGHYRLESLRTLILGNNNLTCINFYTFETGGGAGGYGEERKVLSSDGSYHRQSEEGDSATERLSSTSSSSGLPKSRVLFPALSMLDVGDNEIQSIPSNINELVNLSVLNLSGNRHISELPPQMGLLFKLWNLNTKGCNLQEPLLTMSTSKSYKTSDIIGYLRSILENSKPYARLKLMVVGIQGIGKTTLLELLRQEGGSFKRKPSGDHWAKRMGNKNMKSVGRGGVSISTVGVDIGDWTFEAKHTGLGIGGSGGGRGPVVFRTWDFGGQTEYYSTHQYFLSKRSLYLVVWRITDGEKGMNEIQQWLINIQARAPNSPVIIVGTHSDVVKDEFPPSFSEYLQQRIREKFIHVTDPEKCGLPRVLETVEISCKTKHNIRLLANLLYNTSFNLKAPGTKTSLLEQKIPASYLALEDLVSILSADLKSQGRDPVLNQDQYEEAVSVGLERRFGLRLRDHAELSQATKFLHENGLMLHYDDATLRDLYFLDPQWLCDILSHVVTVREINPFAKNGVMRLEDLKHVFKSSEAVSVSAKSYIVNLLNKFEVALTWDSRTLLIPSLLPTEAQMRSGIPGSDMRVKIAVRTRGWGFRGRRVAGGAGGGGGISASAAAEVQSASARSRSVPARTLLKNKRISKPILAESPDDKPSTSRSEYEMSKRSESEHCIHRLLLMSYFPSGFWSRLLTRILADDSVVEIVRSYFIIPDEMIHDPILARIFTEEKPEWVCWQTGLELRYMDSVLFSMKQVLPKVVTTHDYRSMKLVLYQDNVWAEVDTQSSAILEVLLPQDTVVIKRPVKEGDSTSSSRDNKVIGYQAIVLDPSPKSVCQLLALAVEHIDTLLEDWYPSLGTRFLHTSEGKMLVTRLVPCPRCLANFAEKWAAPKSWQDWSFLQKHNTAAPAVGGGVRVSQESAASDKDSGVGPESPQVGGEGGGTRGNGGAGTMAVEEAEEAAKVYSFLIEECILSAFDGGRHLNCPRHGDLRLGQIAPDAAFLDLDERLRISRDCIVRQGELIGRGAFGFVYESSCRSPAGSQQQHRSVAVKMLQPVDPGSGARESAAAAYRAGKAKWERDPMQYACKAYCTARQELNILMHLRHPHIVPLVGICCNPLSIVLELAPQGALDQKLRHYRRSGDRLSPSCVQLIVLQIARALEYLHQHHIIYRDLKSENVLVWQMPEPFSHHQPRHQSVQVHMKLADYGISRPTLPTGAKGFGGTEGFMAPEIVKYNGEEEYTEKVDSFSFGMFIYELLTLHQPFAGHESVKELILEGGRPPITPRELVYPTYILDLMVVCWSQQPRGRPSSSQLVSIASAPEFAHLVDVVSLDYGSCCAGAVAVPAAATEGRMTTELWMTFSSAFGDYPQLHILEVNELGWQDHMTLRTSLNHHVTSMCLVNDVVWFGDNLGYIHAYSAKHYTKMFTYKMEPDALEDASPVRSIHFLPEINRACVAMHNGRMFLCCADVVPTSQEGCEGTFLVTELGSSSCIHAVASVRNMVEENAVEIWCGESHGAVSVFTLTEGVVTSQEVINHNDPPAEDVEVLEVISDGVSPLVWTFAYPGCHIYQWHSRSSVGGSNGGFSFRREIRNRLDCSKLVPSSESLKSIAIDDNFSPGRCQIASMAVMGTKLYAGTSWGCLIVADAITLRPFSVFRPYSDEIQTMICVTEARGSSTLAPKRARAARRRRARQGKTMPRRKLFLCW